MLLPIWRAEEKARATSVTVYALMKRAHKSNRRSLWSAVAWDTAGKPERSYLAPRRGDGN